MTTARFPQNSDKGDDDSTDEYISQTEDTQDFPDIYVENEDGWGPSEPFANLEFLQLSSSFTKMDNIVVADWYSKRRQRIRTQTGTEVQMLAEQNQDGKDFTIQLTLGANKTKRRIMGKKAVMKMKLSRQQQKDTLRKRKDANKVETGARAFGGFAQERRNKWKKRQNQRYKARQAGKIDNQHKFEPAVTVIPQWQHLADWWLPDMKDLVYDISKIQDMEELTTAGEVRYIKSNLNRIKSSKPVSVKVSKVKIDKNRVSALKDPILVREEENADVFITSEIMSALMACTRSKLAFDIIVVKDEGKIKFDLRPESRLYQPTVDEGICRIVVKKKEDEARLRQWSEEAFTMERNMVEQLLEKKKQPQPLLERNPFKHLISGKTASVAYSYKKWTLPEYSIICRCAFDAYDSDNDRTLIRAATQHNYRASQGSLNWEKELDTKFGHIKTSEVKRNTFKYTRWAVEAMLADAATVNIGFVYRVPNTAKQHCILKVYNCTKKEYCTKFGNVKANNLWAVLDYIITELRKEEVSDGHYIIVRDANKPLLRLYKTGANDFDQDQEG